MFISNSLIASKFPMTVIRKNTRKSRSGNSSIAQSILVIEDQRSLGLLLQNMLTEKWQCDVHLARTLDEARQLLAKQTDYLVAVTDLNLPDAQHGEILDMLDQHKLRAIALTGAFGNELREILLKKGIVDYVLKSSINAYNYVSELVGRLAKNRNITVLVADDSLSIRTMLCQFLSFYGLNVIAAEDGQQALEHLRNNQNIKLMLLDYNMPGKNGIEVLFEARKKFGKDKLAIIGISTASDNSLTARFLKNGANDFIHKPFNYEEVICRVNQNLEVLELIEENHKAANYDHLTGLVNRRFFFHVGQSRLEDFVAANKPVGVAMMDIDHFKSINDRYGHDCGDTVLREFAVLLNKHFNEQMPARLGGEEFAVLFTDQPAKLILKKLEMFRKAVDSFVFDESDNKLHVTISIGLCSEASDDLDALLIKADQNLYKAKNGGRNQVVSC
jgi:diguanylate cyclase (GGDEF)-like protein